jgi:valine--pyruvate aminotransferase
LGSLGPSLAMDLVSSGEITQVSKTIIRPYYEKKAMRAMELLREALDGVDFYIHRPEGAIFLWLWLPGLPITSDELYQRLKQKGVLVIPGHHFFPGLENNWRHMHECIRITYSMQDDVVKRGIELIAGEIKKIVNGQER